METLREMLPRLLLLLLVVHLELPAASCTRGVCGSPCIRCCVGPEKCACFNELGYDMLF